MVGETLEQKVKRYRTRAEEMRGEARVLQDPVAKQAALDVASNYDALAAQLEKRREKRER
jgi:hypothetical protein